MINQPMLASSVKLAQIVYPVWGTPKFDGVRCIIRKGCPVSRNFKPIRNAHIGSKLAGLPNDLDGELILSAMKGQFNKVSSAVMAEEGTPKFVYAIFDYAPDESTPYLTRIENLKKMFVGDHCRYYTQYLPYITLVCPVLLNNETELSEYETKCLKEGYEGIMLRSAASPYKFGRSTVREGWLLKVKRFKDSEAEVTGFVEKIHNANEATKDAFGHSVRTSHKNNLLPAGTLGTLRVKDLTTGVEFGLGTGFDDAERQEIWDAREKFLGKIVKYKYQVSGAKELPRFPVFLGFRDKNDM